MKSKNIELIAKYLENVKKEKKVSEGTVTTYTNIGRNLPFSLTTSQPTIIKKLKELYTNPNTLQLYLNIIILVRRSIDEDTDKLIKLRNSMRDEIIKVRKENLDKLDDKLPTYDYIIKELDNLTGIRYIINYLIINHGLRNKDMNLKLVKTLPGEKTDNYIQNKTKHILLDINDYKTDKTHGNKQIKITNPKFIKEFRDIGLKDGGYLLSKKDNTRIDNVSTFNDKVLSLSIDKLGQNKLFKIVIKHLLNNKEYGKLEQLSNDRGTSLAVILKSYNLENGVEQAEED